MKWDSATDSRKMKEMKKRRQIIVMMLIAVAVASLATAQSEPAAQKTLAATLGVYVFPTQGQDGNALYKRCRVKNSDLAPGQNPGASYFGVIQYLTTDE